MSAIVIDLASYRRTGAIVHRVPTQYSDAPQGAYSDEEIRLARMIEQRAYAMQLTMEGKDES
jgi:hypothetical protein